MPVLFYSDTYMRDTVLEELKRRKEENPAFSVLDVGGAAGTWADEFVTTYIDIVKVPSTKEIIAGDMLDPALWESMKGRTWDFAICTHVLEDIRDPLFVINQMKRVAKGGFIAVPNKHTEFSPVETPDYPGYCHHRWIFTLVGQQTLRAVAKIPLTGIWALSRRGPLELPWFIKSKAKHGYELSFLWETEFQFEYMKDDYYGPNKEAVIKYYREELASGI